MNSFLLWISGLMVAVLGVLFAAPLVIDWNSYRGVLEEEATRILGRDVRVGGKVDLRLLPAPYVRFEKVRISDAGAALGEPFFRAESFTLWLSPTPLLRGALEASELELDRPVLRLGVDAEGRGNWEALKVSPGAMAFMPNDVVLQQVRIRQGIVSLKTTSSPEPLTLSGIDGDVSADSLAGPYRFRGTVDWYGSPREVRIGTSQREADGKLRYKASIRAPRNGNVYNLDGVISELSPAARHTAALSAKIPLANIFPTSTPSRRSPAARGSDMIDLTATLNGDIDGVRIDDMAFSFEHDGKPQLMTGISSANWSSGLRMETRLASKWLDLDQIAGQMIGQITDKSVPPAAGQAAPPSSSTAGTEASTRADPIQLVRTLIGQVSSVLPQDGTSLLTIDIDQVNLGGTPVSAVRLAIARAGGLTSIGELKASLPGNARGELRGTLGAADPRQPNAREVKPRLANEDAFEGELILRGGSYQRFATWAGAGALLPTEDASQSVRVDAPFSLATRIALQPGRVVLTNGAFELAGRRATASVDWTWGAERRLEIAAEGRAIDVRTFAPGLLRATPEAATPAADAVRTTGFPLLARIADRVEAVNRLVGDLKVQLRTAELSDGDTTLRDVEADLTVSTGRLTIASLKAEGTAGSRIVMQGDLRGLSLKRDGRIEGGVRGWLTAGDARAVSALVDLAPEAGRSASRNWLRDASRLDTAFTVDVGAGKPEDRLTLSATGAIDGVEHKLALKLDGGLAGWRRAPISLALTLDGPARTMVRNIMWSPTGSPPRPAPPTSGLARLQIDAAGATPDAMIANARLELDRSATAGYRGRASFGEDGAVELNGTIVLDASDAADAISVLNFGRKPAIGLIPARGTIDVARKWGKTTFASSNLQVGGASLSGETTITQRPDRTRIDATVAASTLDIPSLLALALDDGGNAQPNASAASPGVWSDAPFHLAATDGIEGRIVITSPRSVLTPDLALDATEARLALTPGRIELASLTGSALGGRVTARATLDRAPAGASVSLDLRMTDAAFDRVAGPAVAGIAPAKSPAPAGTFNLSFSGSARGLSPHAAISALGGKGELEIRNGRIPGIAGGLVERAADAVLGQNEEITRDLVASVVAAERFRSQLPLGNRKLALEIAEGIVRVAPLEITVDDTLLKNTTTVELTTLKADSEWQLSPRRGWAPKDSKRRREPLPQVSIVWSGPLSSIARQPPRMSLDSLERDLSIRKLERDAERLEEIRRQDEERARQETERQEAERLRRLEEQSQSQAASPPPSGTQPSAPQGPTIQAPFPIRTPPGSAQHNATTQHNQTAAEPPAKGPLPRVIRPPQRPQFDPR